jgi:glycosyltransferase involved in cell wall biosynthesis
MKILYLSKALVVGAYQTKMEALAAERTVDLVAAAPPVWKDAHRYNRLERVHTEGYELVEVPLVLNGWFHAHFFPTIAQLLDEAQPDLFHIDEEPYNFATLHAGWLARRRGIPFLFFSWQNLLRNYPPPFRWIEQWVFRHAAHAIVGNEDARKVLEQKGYRKATTVLPQFGVDLRLFKMKEIEQEPERPVVFGYAGRLAEEKGLHILMEALAGLGSQQWRCEFRGSGPAQPALEAQAAQLGILQQVAFLPPLPSTDMPRFYQDIDVFVLPSLTRPHWKEQFGRVLIEAMATGNVVVGSDSGEIPHVIGQAGLVVPEGDTCALREALQRLLSDSDLRRTLASAGRERVLAHYTQDAIAHRTARIYEEVLGKDRVAQ